MARRQILILFLSPGELLYQPIRVKIASLKV